MLQMKVVLRPGGGGTEPAESGPEPKPTGGSTDPKTFLAMRARQKIVDARVRLVKRLVLASVAAGAAAAWFAYPRPAPAPALAKVAAPAAVKPAAPPAFATLEEAMAVLNEPEGAGLEAADTVAGSQARRSPAVHTQVASSPASSASPATAGAAETALGATCATDFEARRWRAAIGSCESAFAETQDATLALRVAHSYWSSGQPAPAGSWATKALELGTRDADVFVLIGHAERKAGNPQSAIRAYQQYLQASPRGWHARSVRAALRQLEAKVLSQRSNARPVDTGPSRGQL